MSRLGLLAFGLFWAAPAVADDACLRSYESAQRLRLQTKLIEAKRQLLVCARAECPEVLRRDCSTWLGEVEAATPSVVVAARAGATELTDVRVLVDDRELASSLDGAALPVDPGQRTFRFERADGATLEQKVVIRAGEKNRLLELDFDAEPAPAPAQAVPSRLPVYALLGVGAVALGSFTYFALSSHSKRGDLESCKGHCPEADVDAVRREQLVADVSLGVGLIALGAAAYLHFGTPSERAPERASWQLGFSARRQGGAASLSGRF